MQKIEEIFTRYNFPKNRGGQLENKILKLEKVLSHSLPDDYKSYLLGYDGYEFFVHDQNILLWNLDDLLQVNDDYQIFETCPHFLLIGSNASSEGIGLDYGDESCQTPSVVLAPLLDLDRDEFVQIGSSFTDMILRLERGSNWFD